MGPRARFTRLRPDQDEAETGVWSVTCFFVRRDHRGCNLTGKLLEAAVDYARAHGARTLEAYPVGPDSPSYRFMGFRPLYSRQGFAPVGRAGLAGTSSAGGSGTSPASARMMTLASRPAPMPTLGLRHACARSAIDSGGGGHRRLGGAPHG